MPQLSLLRNSAETEKQPQEQGVTQYQPLEKAALTVKEMASVLGIGSNLAYDLTNLKGFPVLKIGGRKLIPTARLHEWVNQNAGRDFLQGR